MVTDVWFYFTHNFRGAWHTVYRMSYSAQITNEMLPENHTMEK